MTEEKVVWALLAPLPAKQLRSRTNKFWQEYLGDDAEFGERPDVRAGSGDYSMVLDRNPGSEQTHEIPLAEALSHDLPRPVYVLYVSKYFTGSDTVEVYENGQRTGTLSTGPYAFARSLGCTLPDDSVAVAESSVPQTRGVILVQGVKANDVARALGFDAPPQGPLWIEDGPTGALVYNKVFGHAPPVTSDLSRAFPEKDVYKLMTGPTKERFLARLTRGGNDVGQLDIPAPVKFGEPLPKLDSIKGETTARGIATALGVPLALLNLEEQS